MDNQLWYNTVALKAKELDIHIDLLIAGNEVLNKELKATVEEDILFAFALRLSNNFVKNVNQKFDAATAEGLIEPIDERDLPRLSIIQPEFSRFIQFLKEKSITPLVCHKGLLDKANSYIKKAQARHGITGISEIILRLTSKNISDSLDTAEMIDPDS